MPAVQRTTPYSYLLDITQRRDGLVAGDASAFRLRLDAGLPITAVVVGASVAVQ